MEWKMAPVGPDNLPQHILQLNLYIVATYIYIKFLHFRGGWGGHVKIGYDCSGSERYFRFARKFCIGPYPFPFPFKVPYKIFKAGFTLRCFTEFCVANLNIIKNGKNHKNEMVIITKITLPVLVATANSTQLHVLVATTSISVR